MLMQAGSGVAAQFASFNHTWQEKKGLPSEKWSMTTARKTASALTKLQEFWQNLAYNRAQDLVLKSILVILAAAWEDLHIPAYIKQ